MGPLGPSKFDRSGTWGGSEWEEGRRRRRRRRRSEREEVDYGRGRVPVVQESRESLYIDDYWSEGSGVSGEDFEGSEEGEESDE